MFLRADDLAPGLYCTVHSWRPPIEFDRSYHGDVLLIKSVSLPFVACQVAGMWMTTIDSRICNLIKLHGDYVNEVLKGKIELAKRYGNHTLVPQLESMMIRN